MLLANANSIESFDKELIGLTGSTEDWLNLSGVDCLGFDRQTKLLRLLSLTYPEQNKIFNLDRFKKN